MSVLGALVGTVMGGKRDQWRAGVPLCLAIDGEETRTADRFLVLATTLKRLPLGVKAVRPAARGPEVPRRRRAAPAAAGRVSGPAGRQGFRLVAARLSARRCVEAADHHRPAAGRRRRRL
jgi:diacylglycerol kinase (ATP)